MSGTDLLDHQALQAPTEDGNEGDLDEGDEVLLGPLEGDVQPSVVRDPGKKPLHRPAKPSREEFPAPTVGNGLDGNPELLTCPGQALAPVAEIALGPIPGTLCQRVRGASARCL